MGGVGGGIPSYSFTDYFNLLSSVVNVSKKTLDVANWMNRYESLFCANCGMRYNCKRCRKERYPWQIIINTNCKSMQDQQKIEKIFDSNDIVQVLALDGGGLKGIYTASVLKSLEKQAGHPISDSFDIIAGTSTGGLIALGLAISRSADEIQRWYLERGPQIFPSSGVGGKLRSIKSLFASKYSNQTLKTELQEFFLNEQSEQIILGDSVKRLVIPTYLANTSKPRILKTPHLDKYKADWRMPMWAVGMATSAAPTYFPAFRYDGKTYIDGGVWANNPALVGIVEAIDLGASIENIRVLNIGTTFSDSENVFFNVPVVGKNLRRSGLVSWATNLLPMIMQANSHAIANMYVHQLIKKENRFVIDWKSDRGQFKLDDVDMDRLQEIGEVHGEENASNLSDMLSHVAKPYLASELAMK